MPAELPFLPRRPFARRSSQQDGRWPPHPGPAAPGQGRVGGEPPGRGR